MTNLETSPKLLSLEQVAERYSLNLKTLRRWAAERRFPLYKISNLIRVSPEEFDDWARQFHSKPGERR